MDKFNLEERLVDFSVNVIDLVEGLPDTKVGNHVASQLLRSGTSPASNYGEAQSAESRKDFIHKLKLALKELRETHVWLKIVSRKSLFDDSRDLDSLIRENNELIAIFVSSIATAKRNLEARGISNIEQGIMK